MAKKTITSRVLLFLLAGLFVVPFAFAQTSTKGINYVTQAAKPCSGTDVCMWSDTATSDCKYYDGTSTDTVTLLDATQTLANKTLTAPTITGTTSLTTTPILSATGALVVQSTGTLTATGTDVSLVNSGGTGFLSSSGGGYAQIKYAGNGIVNVSGSAMYPSTDIGPSLGASTNRWSSIYQGNDSVGTAQTAGIVLSNDTAATAGNQKYSPMVSYCGRGFNGSSGSRCWATQARPVDGQAQSDLVFWESTGAGAYGEVLKFSTVPSGYPGIFGVSATSFAIGYGSISKIAVSSGGNYTYDHWLPNPDATLTNGNSTYRWLSYNQGNDSVGTAQTVGVSLSNNTAATAGNQKYSPVLELAGKGWKTDATAASRAFKWGIQTRPVQSTSQAVGDLVFWTSENGGAYSEFAAFKYDPVTTVNKFKSNTSIMQFVNSSDTGLSSQSNDIYLVQGGTTRVEISNASHISPYTDFEISSGSSSKRWSSVYTRHIVGGQAAAPTNTPGAGVGTSPTVTVTGTDLSMLISFTTGTSTPAGAQTLFTVTYNTAYAVKPKAVIIQPASSATTTRWITDGFYVDDDDGSTTTTGFVVKATASSLSDTTTYKMMAHVIQ